MLAFLLLAGQSLQAVSAPAAFVGCKKARESKHAAEKANIYCRWSMGMYDLRWPTFL